MVGSDRLRSYDLACDPTILLKLRSYFDDVRRAATITGCNAMRTPFTYLGLPIDCNMASVKNWDPIVDKFNKCLSKWKASMLSIGGRATLVSSVLGSLGTYYLSLFPMPITVCKKLESIRARFFWGIDDSTKKLHWIAWNSVTASKRNGGLGVGSCMTFPLKKEKVMEIVVNVLSSFKVYLQVDGNTESNTATWTVEYENLSEDVPDPDSLLVFAKNVIKYAETRLNPTLVIEAAQKVDNDIKIPLQKFLFYKNIHLTRPNLFMVNVLDMVRRAVPLALMPEDDPQKEELKKLQAKQEEIDELAHKQVRNIWEIKNSR
nr:RNA-directed DNA polymerase, eukaryota, reverse transcriptase zinc-binding domain protein [Tanacetum cinerariifolium]